MSTWETTKNVWHAVVVMVVLTAALFFSKATITGHITQAVQRQPLDLVIDKSQSYVLAATDNNVLPLTSFQISGEVAGNGLVEVFLSNDNGVRRLVYTNTQKSDVTNDLTPAFAERTNAATQITFTKYRELDDDITQKSSDTRAGNFRNVCSETCNLNPALFNNQRYELLFYVEKGTTLRVSEIAFT